MLCNVAVSTFKLSNREIGKEYREALKKFNTAPKNVSKYFVTYIYLNFKSLGNRFLVFQFYIVDLDFLMP